MWSGKPPLLIALDIETSGPSVLKNGILSIGYCVGDYQGKILQRKRIDVSLDEGMTFDETTVKNFWQKGSKPKVLKDIQRSTISAKAGAKQFAAMLDAYDSKYKVDVLTDNPTFDIHFINYYLDKYLGRKAINYLFGVTYTPRTIDTSSFLRGKYRDKSQEIFHFGDVRFRHYPEHDAHFIYARYLNSLRWR